MIYISEHFLIPLPPCSCGRSVTGYDPLLDNEPGPARTMAASVKQRIAFGERAGEEVRRIGGIS